MNDGIGPLVAVTVAFFFVLGVAGGAELAALLHGHVLHLTAIEVAPALGRLPRHLRDPRLAWPLTRRAALPGPVLYWCAQLVAFAVTTGAAVAVITPLVRHRQRVGMQRRRRLGVDTDARFARLDDIAPLVVKEPVPGRLIIGRVCSRLVATEDPDGEPERRTAHARAGARTSVAMVGPTRCGKSTTTISAVLDWSGPAILGSVKSDLLARTGGARRKRGEVKVFDPLQTTGHASAYWSPLPVCVTPSGAQRFAHALAEAAPAGNVTNADFFTSQAEGLMWALLHLASPATRMGLGMADVVRWVLTQTRADDMNPRAVGRALKQLENTRDKEAYNLVGQSLEAIWRYDDRTRGAIYATAGNHVRPWLDPAVRHWTDVRHCKDGSTVDLAWLMNDENTLYVCAPLKDARRLSPVFGGLYGDLVDQAYAHYNKGAVPLERPLLLVLDEAANTPVEWLPEVAATCAGIGIQMLTIWQSIAQIEESFGRQAGAVLTNHGTKVFFSGLSDDASLGYVSRLLGEEDVAKVSLSTGGPRGASVSHTTQATKLAPMDVIRRVAPGQAVLIHGTLRPAHLFTLPYYLDDRLKSLAEIPYLEKPASTKPVEGSQNPPGSAPEPVCEERAAAG